MLGIGLGLLVAFFICINSFPGYTASRNWDVERQASVVYGACVLLFGGAGLLTAFLIEMKIQKKENKKPKSPKPHLQRCNFGDLICSH